jgi:hypothetical protein
MNIFKGEGSGVRDEGVRIKRKGVRGKGKPEAEFSILNF